MEIKHLKDPVYNFKLNLVTNCSYKDFVKFLLENEKYNIEDYADGTIGMYVPIADKDVYFLYIKDTKNIPVIAHEILHLVFDMLKTKGISMDESSEEAYTYSFEYWLNLVLSKLSSK